MYISIHIYLYTHTNKSMYVYERIEKSSLRYLYHTHIYSKVVRMGKRQKQTRCLKTDDCINKTQNINTIEYHLTLGEKFTHIIICMNLESIRLSEISQSLSDEYCIILQICKLNSKM